MAIYMQWLWILKKQTKKLKLFQTCINFLTFAEYKIKYFLRMLVTKCYLFICSPSPHTMEINEQLTFFYQHSNIIQNILFYVKQINK